MVISFCFFSIEKYPERDPDPLAEVNANPPIPRGVKILF